MDRNQALLERAQKVIPGGVNSPVRAFRSVGGAPRFIERAKGPYMWDVEDKRSTAAFPSAPPPAPRLKSPKRSRASFPRWKRCAS